MVNVYAKTSSRYHKPVRWPFCVRGLDSIQYNMLYRPGPIKRLNWESWYHREQTTCWVAVGPKQITDGIRGSPGLVCHRSLLNLASPCFRLFFSPNRQSLAIATPHLRVCVCACACTLAGSRYWSPLPRHFLRLPAKSSSDARRLPCSLHPQILAAYALLQLALPWALDVERLAATAWVLRLRRRVAMM